jgi:hypothetical protein
MKIATFGSWVDKSDAAWKSRGERKQFEIACQQIGQKIAALGHAAIVGSSRPHTADKHVVDGIISASAPNSKLSSKNSNIIVIRPVDQVREYVELSRRWPNKFTFPHRPNLKSEGAKVLGVKDADVVITIAGAEVTYLAGLTAVFAKKPLVPIASFGGASEQLIRAVRELEGRADSLEVLRSPWNPHMLDAAFKIAGLIQDPKPEVNVAEKVFIVHGHDAGARDAVALVLSMIGLQPIILSEQTDRGRAIIEKFEDHAGEANFAVVLLTPDDIGGVKTGPTTARPRQNVVFELGFFVGRLGRGKVHLLKRGDLEGFSDFQGVVYTELDSHGAWKFRLAHELKAAGLHVDMAKVIPS